MISRIYAVIIATLQLGFRASMTRSRVKLTRNISVVEIHNGIVESRSHRERECENFSHRCFNSRDPTLPISYQWFTAIQPSRIDSHLHILGQSSSTINVDLSSYSTPRNRPIVPLFDAPSIEHFLRSRTSPLTTHSALKSTRVERSVWSLPAIWETGRSIARTIATTIMVEMPGQGNVRPTCDGAGRTFVQDGFDARTGDEREPREQPGRTESEASTRSENERANRREMVRRPSNWRKGERGRPNGASLSSPGFEIRISPAPYTQVTPSRPNELLKLPFPR